jgi:hypothetical protein
MVVSNAKLKRLVSEQSLEELVFKDITSGNVWSAPVSQAQKMHGMTELWACRLVNQPCGTHRYQPMQ